MVELEALAGLCVFLVVVVGFSVVVVGSPAADGGLVVRLEGVLGTSSVGGATAVAAKHGSL